MLIGISPQLSVSRTAQYLLMGKEFALAVIEVQKIKEAVQGQYYRARGCWVASSGNVTVEVWK